MNILRLTGGVTLLFVFLITSCIKEVSYFEEEIPEGKIVMKSRFPQRVSDQMILEIVNINDSRCPIGVVCSSGGQVGVEFKAYVNGSFCDLTVNFGELANAQVNSITCEGHVIHILKVSPNLYVDENIDLEDYAIELQVEQL